jgi:hypothetical protein
VAQGRRADAPALRKQAQTNPYRFTEESMTDDFGERKMINQRLRSVEVSMDLLCDLFIQGRQVRSEVLQGIPKGATLNCVIDDHNRNVVSFLFEHEQFPPIAFSQPLPVQEMVMRRLDDEAALAETIARLEAENEHLRRALWLAEHPNEKRT